MKSKEDILAEAMGIVIYREMQRRNLNKTGFCHENDIAVTTLYEFMGGKRKPNCVFCFKLFCGLGIISEMFITSIMDELPPDFEM